MPFVLAVISLDAVARPLIDRMIDAGRLPHLAALLRRGTTHPMKTTPVHASIYRSLYTGFSMATHGVHYPMQWSASRQRVVPADALKQEDTIFGRLDRAGRRMLVIDPPECGRLAPQHGMVISGWQFTTRFVLPRWYSSPAIAKGLERQFGPARSCNEVFGQPSTVHLRTIHEVLADAPRRLVAGAAACLKAGAFDVVWLTFVAAHIGGHQLWRASLDAPPAANGADPQLLAHLYENVDDAIGQLMTILPPSSDVIVFSANGMGAETSCADLLPAMLARILARGSRPRAGSTSPMWRLRTALPTTLRARVADLMTDRTALEVAARLETIGVNWTRTRAFAPPSDGPGFVRVNLQGRERDGIVPAAAAQALLEEIQSGLETFVDASGERVVASITRPTELDGKGPNVHALPDLIVEWTNKPVAGLRAVASPKFGDVRRNGVGSGRSGNHPGATWATVIPGGSRRSVPRCDSATAMDLAATICSVMGVDHTDLPGRSLLQ